MSNGMDENPPGARWTIDSLYEHFEKLAAEREIRYKQRFEATETSLKLASDGTEKALKLAQDSTEKRFDTVFDSIRSLQDQIGTFLRRSEYDIGHSALTEKVDALIRKFDASEGRGTGLNQGWVYLLGIISSVAAVSAVLLTLLHH